MTIYQPMIDISMEFHKPWEKVQALSTLGFYDTVPYKQEFSSGCSVGWEIRSYRVGVY